VKQVQDGSLDIVEWIPERFHVPIGVKESVAPLVLEEGEDLVGCGRLAEASFGIDAK
jgi:hypothetical protein